MKQPPTPPAAPNSHQLRLFDAPEPDTVPDLDALLTTRETQWFERKGQRISAAQLAECMIGFANADGGRLVVGLHGGRVEGIDTAPPSRLNDWLQAGRDFAEPPVRSAARPLDCLNQHGQPDRVLIIDVEASESVHRTPGGKCFLRVGDETRELGPTEARELAFDKHEAQYDSSPVPDCTLDDLNRPRIEAYARQMGSTDVGVLMRSRGIYRDRGGRPGVTQAGRLVFGLDTPIWSYVRFLRYDGSVAETGTRSNLAEDIRLEGTIPDLIERTQALLRQQVGTVIRLLPSGRFGRVAALPEFAWLEAVVNALIHRSYSLQGDGVHIRQFSDRLEVQSPGRLPGLVRVQEIQNARFSRNPHIARILAEMTDYVRELNEGVRRMFREMQEMNLRPPAYRVTDSHVTVTLYKQVGDEAASGASLAKQTMNAGGKARSLGRHGVRHLPQLALLLQTPNGLATHEVATALNVSIPSARRYLGALEEQGLVIRTAKSVNDPHTRWVGDAPERWAVILTQLPVENPPPDDPSE
jgi:ATP-dependent DNA helicase RecG